MSMHQTWFPPEDHIHTGRLCSIGSELPTSSPTSTLVCSPPTSSLPSAVTLFASFACSPRQRPTSMQGLVLDRPRMLPQTRSASETGHRLSASPVSFEEKQGSPGLLGRPLRARHGPLAACGCSPTSDTTSPFAPTSLREDPRRGHHRLQGKQNPGHPERHSFRGRNSMAHTLVHLRFVGLVAETVARLTTGSGGLTPGWAGFAPAGRQIEV